MVNLLESILSSENTFELNIEIPYEKKLINSLDTITKNCFGSFKNFTVDNFNDILTIHTPKYGLTTLNVKNCLTWIFNISKLYNKNVKNNGKLTVHYNFPRLNPEKRMWLYSNISINEDMIEVLHKFNSFFYDCYSIDSFKNNNKYIKLKTLQNFIINNDYDKLFTILLKINRSKFPLYEYGYFFPDEHWVWECPNNFLDNFSLIKDVFITLLKLTAWISNTLNSQEINGLSKQNFFDMYEEVKTNFKKIRLN